MARKRRAFLLSPAHCGGKRAAVLQNPSASFDLAQRLRPEQGVALGEVFSFLSGLYFRGKLAYASHFAVETSLVRVITTNRGLLSPEAAIRTHDLTAFGCVDIASGDAAFREPLARACDALASDIAGGEVVLLGSIATAKYTELLLDRFGERLLFPAEFVGRGDMSRGALMLRAAQADRELDYIPVKGAVVRGRRATRVGETVTTGRPSSPASPA